MFQKSVGYVCSMCRTCYGDVPGISGQRASRGRERIWGRSSCRGEANRASGRRWTTTDDGRRTTDDEPTGTDDGRRRRTHDGLNDGRMDRRRWRRTKTTMISIYSFICINRCISSYICIKICMYVCIHLFGVYIYIYIHTDTCRFQHIQINGYILTSLCIHIYSYTFV